MSQPQSASSEAGETLIELIVAITIMATTGVMFLGLLADVVILSGTEAAAAQTHALITSLAEQATSIPFVACAGGADYDVELSVSPLTALPTSIPAGYAYSVGVVPWSGSAYAGAATLATSVDSTATTITIPPGDASGLPSGGPFRVRVVGPAPALAPELMTVTGGFGGTDLTVTRAPGAVGHAAGAQIVVCPAAPSRVQRLDIAVTGPPGSAPTTIDPQGRLSQLISVAKRGPLYLPTLRTHASPGVTVGDGTPISDTATLTGSRDSTGTVSFDLFGPGNPDCAPPPAAVRQLSPPANVAGDGTYDSGGYVPTTAGDYEWIARYSGDTANQAATDACAEPTESVTVAKAGVRLTAAATQTAAHVGDSITDAATLAGGYNPTGAIAFDLYGPGDTGCSTPVFATTTGLTGSAATSAAYTPTAPGTYLWTAGYAGDVNNTAPPPPACGAAGQSVSVSP